MTETKTCLICENEYGPGLTPDGDIKTKYNWQRSVTCSAACKAIYCGQGNHERAEAARLKRQDGLNKHKIWWKRFCFPNTGETA
jgi:hypothetical protein